MNQSKNLLININLLNNSVTNQSHFFKFSTNYMKFNQQTVMQTLHLLINNNLYNELTDSEPLLL